MTIAHEAVYSAFFYGTLLHPKILKRVIGNDGSHLEICSAVLLLTMIRQDHTRHKIKHADYPGLIPYTQSRVLFETDLDLDQRCVRGSLVQGLSKADVEFLDIFEGNEYRRETVQVHPLTPIVPLNSTIAPDVRLASSTVKSESSSIVPEDSEPLTELTALAPPVACETYIWCKPLSELERDLWSYAEFVRTNCWKWVGSGSDDNKDYKEVERRQEMQGVIVHS